MLRHLGNSESVKSIGVIGLGKMGVLHSAIVNSFPKQEVHRCIGRGVPALKRRPSFSVICESEIGEGTVVHDHVNYANAGLAEVARSIHTFTLKKAS